MKYKLIIFDCDGTLINSSRSIVYGVQKTAKDYGFAVPKAEVILKAVGLPIEVQLKDMFPELDKNNLQKFINDFRINYLFKNHEVPYDGVIDTLHYLKNKGYILAIATSRIRRELTNVLNKFNLEPLFTTTRCADDTYKKPDPHVLLDLIQELMITPDQAIMIGDTTFDLMMARNAKIDAIGITYGVHSKQELRKYSDVCIDDIISLQKIL